MNQSIIRNAIQTVGKEKKKKKENENAILDK